MKNFAIAALAAVQTLASHDALSVKYNDQSRSVYVDEE